MKSGKKRLSKVIMILMCYCSFPIMVGNGHGQDQSTDLVKKTQNSVSDLISVPFQIALLFPK